MKITDELSINPDDVESVGVDTRHYFNGSQSWLIINMRGGKQYRIEHLPYYLGGIDAWKLKYLIEAKMRLQ